MRNPAFLFVAIVGLLWPVHASAGPRAIDVAVSDADGATRLAVSVDATPSFRSFVVSSPPRLVIDMDDVTFDLDGAAAPPAGHVAAWRYGQMGTDAARLVIDLERPALVSKEFYLPPLGDAAGRLVIELVDATEAEFAAAVSGATASRSRARAAVAERGPVVVIDPGHGGIDPGARTDEGVAEKDVVLAFSQRLKEDLEALGRFRVRMTRTDDRFLSLSRRIRLARAWDADLFISIHADAAPQDYVQGATVYTLSERPSDAQAAALAARENLADEVSGTIEPAVQEEVSGILADLLRRETKTFSHAFADALIASLGQSVTLNSRPHRSARFRVLMAHDVPSVLLELGYLTNEEDAGRLTDAAWQASASRAVAAAVATYFEAPRSAAEERALLATRQP